MQAFGENVLFEVADPPCWWDVYEEPFVVGYWFWEWLVKVKGKLGLKVREEAHRIDILAEYVRFLTAAWTVPSSSVQLPARLYLLCVLGYHLQETLLNMS